MPPRANLVGFEKLKNTPWKHDRKPCLRGPWVLKRLHGLFVVALNETSKFNHIEVNSRVFEVIRPV